MRGVRISPMALTLRAALCALAVASAAPAGARCVDEDTLEAFSQGASAAVPDADPRGQLQALVQEALSRSHGVGASQLLAMAAAQDVEETRAAKALQASAGVGFGPGGTRTSEGTSASSPSQLRASVNLSQLLWDGGRNDRLVDWRQHIAESARLGNLNKPSCR